MTRSTFFRTGLRRSLIATAVGATMAATAVSNTAMAQERELLNSSYDIARELFSAINPNSKRGGKKSTVKRLPLANPTAALQRKRARLCKECVRMSLPLTK